MMNMKGMGDSSLSKMISQDKQQPCDDEIVGDASSSGYSEEPDHTSTSVSLDDSILCQPQTPSNKESSRLFYLPIKISTDTNLDTQEAVQVVVQNLLHKHNSSSSILSETDNKVLNRLIRKELQEQLRSPQPHQEKGERTNRYPSSSSRRASYTPGIEERYRSKIGFVDDTAQQQRHYSMGHGSCHSHNLNNTNTCPLPYSAVGPPAKQKYSNLGSRLFQKAMDDHSQHRDLTVRSRRTTKDTSTHGTTIEEYLSKSTHHKPSFAAPANNSASKSIAAINTSKNCNSSRINNTSMLRELHHNSFADFLNNSTASFGRRPSLTFSSFTSFSNSNASFGLAKSNNQAAPTRQASRLADSHKPHKTQVDNHNTHKGEEYTEMVDPIGETKPTERGRARDAEGQDSHSNDNNAKSKRMSSKEDTRRRSQSAGNRSNSHGPRSKSRQRSKSRGHRSKSRGRRKSTERKCKMDHTKDEKATNKPQERKSRRCKSSGPRGSYHSVNGRGASVEDRRLSSTSKHNHHHQHCSTARASNATTHRDLGCSQKFIFPKQSLSGSMSSLTVSTLHSDQIITTERRRTAANNKGYMSDSSTNRRSSRRRRQEASLEHSSRRHDKSGSKQVSTISSAEPTLTTRRAATQVIKRDDSWEQREERRILAEAFQDMPSLH